METRRLRVLDDTEVARIADTYHAWRNHDGAYEDVPGFCKASPRDEIASHDFVLTPGRYVGAEEAEADDEPIDEKVERLKKELYAELDRGRDLEILIRTRLDQLDA
jgi:type I restriction enzyme M protein